MIILTAGKFLTAKLHERTQKMKNLHFVSFRVFSGLPIRVFQDV